MTILFFLAGSILGEDSMAPAEEAESPPLEKELRFLDPQSPDYRTPRAGEGFRTEVFGRSVTVEPRNRRFVAAWDAGFSAVAPGVPESEVLPFGSLFFWRHPDEETIFRGLMLGIFNSLYFAKSADRLRPFEGVLTFENRTVPFDQAESIDGERIEEEELRWGRLHFGVGAGYRRQLEKPGYDDNMFEVSLLAEPGYLYFAEGHDTADNFIVPQDTFELRGRLRIRLDKLERNLLELPHAGFATGADLVGGHRANWEAWGPGGQEEPTRAQDYLAFSGYLVLAGRVPFAGSDRHGWVTYLHGGTGDDLDRFSSFRVGGGPQGDEYESISHPVLPGALIEEFVTSHYGILIGEYRWEPIFFTYLSLRSSVSYVNRERLQNGKSEEEDDVLASVGFRITTGFLLKTRLQLDYDFNASVIRDGSYGGHEVTLHIARQF